jgi:hypothetical protein
VYECVFVDPYTLSILNQKFKRACRKIRNFKKK